MIRGPCTESLGNVTFFMQRTESETPRDCEYIPRGKTVDRGRSASGEERKAAYKIKMHQVK